MEYYHSNQLINNIYKQIQMIVGVVLVKIMEPA